VADLVKRIGTEEGALIFTFTRIYTVKGPIYFAAVTGQRSQHFFHMEKRDGTWKIVKAPQPPYWIIEHEEELGKFLEEQNNSKRYPQQ
jgi:3-polyprenyl-4-hydroxybenzoate decarboxylase